MYTIREFNHSETDFEALVAIGNAEWPTEPTTLENAKFWEENRNKKFLSQRFMVEKATEDGSGVEIVGRVRHLGVLMVTCPRKVRCWLWYLSPICRTRD